MGAVAAPPPLAGAPDSPEQALAAGRWVKLICGAGNQDLASIEDLCAIYALAGVHCIDVAADRAVVAAARRGLAWAAEQEQPPAEGRPEAPRPWLMVSLSDGEDPHFRKARFDPALCPPDCPRPCQRVCPALAISADGGVIPERCYGCGRCLPACPLGLIGEVHQILAAEAVAPLLAELRPDAVELHTQPGRLEPFARRLEQVRASGVPLRRLAVSCGLERGAAGPEAAQPRAALTSRQLAAELWQRFALVRAAGLRPLWQLDGRPMSGDVGAGTARAAVALLAELQAWAPPGPLQLAGGTNGRTLALLPPGDRAAGVAFGSVARRQLQPLLQQAEAAGRPLRELPELRRQALELARALVEPWRQRGRDAAG
ncbi:LdpA C-terminal domain-containing domain [Vulcanococcus limneticus]|uniref:Light dependent period protein LdpA domain-containing protein n=1 Tax=Vulcanococcus limneticus TaxID=2170428 RepID=UPI00398BE9BF